MLHIVKLAISKARELAVKKNPLGKRSSKWPAIEKAKLSKSPACECCGATKHLQVHHIHPFHLHPELELDMNNLVTLCMDKNECHIKVGHGDNFKAYNPNLLSDLADAKSDISKLPDIWIRAKANRKFE